jgi:hypothetical protein
VKFTYIEVNSNYKVSCGEAVGGMKWENIVMVKYATERKREKGRKKERKKVRKRVRKTDRVNVE